MTAAAASRRAVFLDRDGTIIEDVGYPSSPDQIRLLPGAAAAIRRLNTRGLLAVVVTNQSGIARGLYSEEDYLAGERRLDELLEREGARLDAHYFCPHLPEVTGPCDCRKPGPLLYHRAAERFGIDLTRSWWVGDRIRDVAPAEAFGGSGILIRTAPGQAEATSAEARGFMQASDLIQAVEILLERSS